MERWTAPAAEIRAAWHASAASHAASVLRWAPAESKAADGALDEARRLEAAVESRWLPARDYTPVAVSYIRACTLSSTALRATLVRRRAAGLSATAAIDEARRARADAETAASAVGPSASERHALSEARVLFDKAVALQGDGDFDAARSRAGQSATEFRRAASRIRGRVRRYSDPSLLRTWRHWVAETLAESRHSGRVAIVVVKERNEVILFRAGRRVAVYDADMGRNSTVRKTRAGDAATPEGRYRIVALRDVGSSSFHRALLLDYPNAEDRRRLRREIGSGAASRRSRPGGSIEIHGEGGRGKDWTDGCVALSNTDMDRLFAQVRVGTLVTIVGSDGRQGKFSSLAEARPGAE